MLPPHVVLGTAYYPEYLPRSLGDRTELDLDLMVAAGITAIRVGESVWSTWEPRDGVFDLEWIRPVLDGAKDRGIGVILGTPTYAVPPWLQRAHPEIAAERRTGIPVPWGIRQEIDYGQPAFRFHAERVVRRIVERYRDHPAVIGYQVDNEPGVLLAHNSSAFEAFVTGLRREYGDVETLNEAWGLTYWSHRLSDWSELWRPDGNSTPSYDLAWRRFQAARTSEFIGWQAEIVHALRRPGQFVTTCLAYDRPAVADVPLTSQLDVAAGNIYVDVQDGLARPAVPSRLSPGWIGRSVAELFLATDRMYGSRGEPFLVTETNATSIGGSHENRPPYDGQLRQLAWAMVSRGARMVSYWHWHSIHHGAETFWGGILGHGLQPGRVYQEIAGLGAELAAAGASVVGLTPDVDVAVLWSNESDWALQFQPPLATPGGIPDKASYRTIVGAFYEGILDAGLRPGVVPVERLEAALEAPVVVAAGLYVVSDTVLDRLVEYARSGGHLILGPRTGYADLEARPRVEDGPPRLREAAGLVYQEFENLGAPLPVEGLAGHATRWAETLVVDDAKVLAWYDHPSGERRPIITTKPFGAGQITYVGTVPDAQLSAALHGESHRWAPSVTALSAVNPAGERLWFLHNWSATPTTLTPPLPLEPLGTVESRTPIEPPAVGAQAAASRAPGTHAVVSRTPGMPSAGPQVSAASPATEPLGAVDVGASVQSPVVGTQAVRSPAPGTRALGSPALGSDAAGLRVPGMPSAGAQVSAGSPATDPLGAADSRAPVQPSAVEAPAPPPGTQAGGEPAAGAQVSAGSASGGAHVSTGAPAGGALGGVGLVELGPWDVRVFKEAQ